MIIWCKWNVNTTIKIPSKTTKIHELREIPMKIDIEKSGKFWEFFKKIRKKS